MEMIPFSYAKQFGVLVDVDEANSPTVLYRSPLKKNIFLELQRYFTVPLRWRAVSPEIFETHLTRHYETTAADAMTIIDTMGDTVNLAELVNALPKSEELLDNKNEAPIVQFINAILIEAIKIRASDIHIETFEEQLVVRFRIDGLLREVIKPQRTIAPLIVSRIKVMAHLDIAEKRLPQDGRITLKIAGRAVDVRVSTIPTHYGERIVLRLLDKKNAVLDLSHLGMSTIALQTTEKIIQKPHGIFLMTGPTGSGKTTTLYALLSRLNTEDRNILTVEDPVEYDLIGIGQTQVNPKIDMTFAKTLRAILRQDPDVVMVGEIRDLETAQVAVQASLTGHLVLSTLHTNTAIGAVTRLRDMGIEPFLLASSLIGVAAQRLIRVLCEYCKKRVPLSLDEKKFLSSCQIFLDTHEKAVGCEHCFQTGYKGRTGIYEMILLDDRLVCMIHDNTTEQEMARYAHGLYPSLQQDACRLVALGQTTLEEVYRISKVDF